MPAWTGYTDSLYCIYQTLAISVPTVVDGLARRMTPTRADLRLDAWSKKILARGRIDLHVHGLGAVDVARSYVVMSNHQSVLDIPVLYQVVPFRLRMVAKEELFRVPVWGKAMHDAGMIRVDRRNRKQAIASLRIAAATIRGGTSVWIAPEGTRSKTGELQTLKKGGFHLARDTQTPILPIALLGTRDILPTGTTRMHRGVRVDAVVGKPISVEGKDTPTLMEEVRIYLADQLLRQRPAA